VVRLVAVPVAQARAAQQRARLDARAALTARLHDLAWDGLAVEACWCSLPATLDELTSVTLTAVRWAAVALEADPADVLAVLLMTRAAVEVEPTSGDG
jgi:hypothetical protein